MPSSFGLGNFNHGFRTPSSIFYLNSLFYLPVIKYYFFLLSIYKYNSLIFEEALFVNSAGIIE